MLRRIGTLLVFCCLFAGLLPSPVQAEALPHIVISELKLGGQVTGQPTEFVELFNDGSEPINLAGWVLEYAKSAAELTQTDCAANDWQTIAGTRLIKQTELAETIVQPGQRAVVPLALTDNMGGSLRLVRPAEDGAPHKVYDLIGWASATSDAPCFEGTVPSPLPKNGASLKRKFDSQKHAVDTQQNNTDFALSDATDEPTGPGATDPSAQPNNPTDTSQCHGIVISEILANPAGSDSDAEFIELYNNSATQQSLAGCSLKTSANTKQYNLPADQTLAPGEYRALYDSQTNLTLTNTGGEVTLITPTTENVVQYPEAADSQAWAVFGSEWKATLSPTPNQVNVLTEPGRGGVDESTASGDTELTPCPAGKYRNPETNRCKNIESTDNEQKSCDAGQERNPATNRCRNITTAQASPASCAEGSERNPETNRCRKVATASATTTKPCDPGEERNPTTNRCRKKVAAATTNNAANLAAPKNTSSTPLHYGIFGLVALGLVGYGAYEYRSDLGNLWSKLRPRKNTPQA